MKLPLGSTAKRRRQKAAGSLRDLRWLVFVAATGALVARCTPSCPPGTNDDGGYCKRPPDGTPADGTAGSSDSPAHGSTASAVDSSESAPAQDGAGMAAPRGEVGGSNSENAGSMSMTSIADAGEPMRSSTIAAGDAGTPTCPNGALSAPEVCDNKDNDCDGQIDEDVEMECGTSSLGTCKLGKKTCAAGTWSDCKGAVEPTKEICDAAKLDENCNGTANEGCQCTDGDAQSCTVAGGSCVGGMKKCMEGQWSDCVCQTTGHVFQAVGSGICATSIGVGSNDSAWILGCGGKEAAGNNSLFQLKNGTWSTVTGAGVQIAVSPEGIPWVVNNKGELYKWKNGAFELVPIDCITWVGVGSNETAWAVGCGGKEADGNNGIFQLSNGSWVKVTGAGVQLAVSPEGNPWVLNNKGEVYRWNGSAFEQAPQTCAAAIGVGANGMAWAISCSAESVLQLKNGAWAPGNGTAKQIAVSPEGTPWLINDQGAVLR